MRRRPPLPEASRRRRASLRAASVTSNAAMLGIGTCTLVVANLKILDPLNPLEDFLGLFLAAGYVVIGVRLVRSGARVAPRRTAAKPTPT